MQTNRKYEKEFNLRDLFFHVLYHWRSIIAVMLICAIVFGGYQFISHRIKKTPVPIATPKMDISSNDPDSKEIEIKASLAKSNKEYLEKSLLMKLDALDCWTGLNRYIVQVDQNGTKELSMTATDPADSLLLIYSNIIEKDVNREELNDIFGTDNLALIREVVLTGYDTATNYFYLQTVAPTKEEAEKWLDYYAKKIMRFYEKEAQEVYPHKIELFSSLVSEVVSRGFANTQNTYIDQAVNYQAAYNALLKKPKTEVKVDLDEPRMISTAEGAVTGAALGFVLMLLFYAVSYLLSSKLHSGQELAKRYSLPIYGDFKQSRARKPGKGIDKIIEKWEFKDDRRTDELVYQNICTLLADQEGLHRILLASTLPEETVKEIPKNLKSKLDGTEVLLAADFLNSSSGIQMATEVDAVLILEKKYTTRSQEVARMAEMLQISGAKVIGSIVL